eukprot:gene17479-23785_t
MIAGMKMKSATAAAAPFSANRNAARRPLVAAGLYKPHTASRSSRPVRTNAVVAEANLFARMARLVRSTIGNWVYQAEDPEKLLDTVLNDMNGDLIKMRQASAQVMGSQKQIEVKYKLAQKTADEWLRRAELAVRKGEDELAKEALTRRKAFQEQASGLQQQLELQNKAVDQLLGNARVLENKFAEARSKKDTLKARAASAKTTKQIQEMIGSLNTSNPVVAFDKMEERVMTMEAEAESTALLVGNDKIETKFALLEGSSVEDELAALKAGMAKGSVSSPSTPTPLLAEPAGRPMKDAFDMELEELRVRVKGL